MRPGEIHLIRLERIQPAFGTECIEVVQGVLLRASPATAGRAVDAAGARSGLGVGRTGDLLVLQVLVYELMPEPVAVLIGMRVADEPAMRLVPCLARSPPPSC